MLIHGGDWVGFLSWCKGLWYVRYVYRGLSCGGSAGRSSSLGLSLLLPRRPVDLFGDWRIIAFTLSALTVSARCTTATTDFPIRHVSKDPTQAHCLLTCVDSTGKPSRFAVVC